MQKATVTNHEIIGIHSFTTSGSIFPRAVLKSKKMKKQHMTAAPIAISKIKRHPFLFEIFMLAANLKS